MRRYSILLSAVAMYVLCLGSGVMAQAQGEGAPPDYGLILAGLLVVAIAAGIVVVRHMIAKRREQERIRNLMEELTESD